MIISCHAMLGLADALREKEYQYFCKKQCEGRRYIPLRQEYIMATKLAYDAENLPKYPKWKSLLAKTMIRMFKL